MVSTLQEQREKMWVNESLVLRCHKLGHLCVERQRRDPAPSLSLPAPELNA